MKDKEVKELIKMLDENKEKTLKEDKKQNKKELIRSIMYILALVVVILVGIGIVGIQTKKDVKKCLKNGYSENYCLRVSR